MHKHNTEAGKLVANTVVKSLIGIGIGTVANLALDQYLASKENPGMFNRLVRWYLKAGRNPKRIATVLLLQVAAAAAVEVVIDNEFAKQDDEGSK